MAELSQEDVDQQLALRDKGNAALKAAFYANQPPEPTPSQETSPTDPNASFPVHKTKTAQLSPQSTETIDSAPSIPQLNIANMPNPEDFGLGARQHAQSSFEVFKNPLIWLTLLGSLATRRPAVAAMNAASAAMKGFDARQHQDFEDNKAKFDEQVKATVDQNNVAIQKYKAAWDTREEVTNQNFAKLYAASHDNPVLQAYMRAGDFKGAAEYIKDYEKNNMAVDRSLEKQRLEQIQKDAEIDRLKQDPAIQDIAKAVYEYRRPAPPMSRMNPRNEAVNELVEEYGNQKGNPFQQTGYGERNKTIQVMASGQGKGANIIAINAAIKHFKTMDRLIDELKNGDYRHFNQWRQSIEEERGKPAVTNYDLAADIVSKEVVKSLVASGGGVTERSEIEAKFARDRSPEALHGLVRTGTELLAGQFDSLKNWATAGHATAEFDKRIEPETRSAMEAVRQVNVGTGETTIKVDRAAAKKAGWTDQQIDDYESGKIDAYGRTRGGK